MKLLLFDYRCSYGHISEIMTPADVREATCHCGALANRLMSAPRAKLEGFTGDFPGAADAWERRRDSHMKWERKHLDANGEIPGNPLPKC